MTRFLLFVLAGHLVALAVACGSGSPRLSPEAAYLAGVEAIRQDDADLAVVRFRQAAAGGHLVAARQLAAAYEHGSINASFDPGSEMAMLEASPRRAARHRRVYERLLADSVRAGDTQSMLFAATEMLGMRMYVPDRDDFPEEIRASHYDAVDMDSVRALYDRIGDADLPVLRRLDMGWIARALGDTTGAIRHFERAAEDDPTVACIYTIQVRYGPSDLSTAAGLADHFDHTADCDPTGRLIEGGASAIANIQASADGGAERSRVVLDSLHTLGVFERHPALTQGLSPTPDA